MGKLLFDKCVETTSPLNTDKKKEDHIRKVFNQTSSKFNSLFRVFDNDRDKHIDILSQEELGKLLGYMESEFSDMSTFLKPSISPNLTDPSQGFVLMIDQPVTFFDRRIHMEYGKVGGDLQGLFTKQVLKAIQQFAKIVGKTINETQLQEDIDEVFELDQHIAIKIVIPEIEQTSIAS